MRTKINVDKIVLNNMIRRIHTIMRAIGGQVRTS